MTFRIFIFSSSSAFHDCPQLSRVMVYTIKQTNKQISKQVNTQTNKIYFIYKHQTVFLNVFKGWDYFLHFTSELHLVSCSWTISLILHVQHCVESLSCSWTISLILHIQHFFSLFLQLDYFTHFTYSAVFF